MILSKLFLPEGRMCRVKRNEKKAGKKRRKRSKRQFGMVLVKKKVQILAYEHAPK